MDIKDKCKKIDSMSTTEKEQLLLELASKLSDEKLDELIAMCITEKIKLLEMTLPELRDFFRNQAKNLPKEELAIIMAKDGYKLSAVPLAIYIVHHRSELAELWLAEYIKAMSPEFRERLYDYIKNNEEGLFI